jgi:methionyl-tRNA formyltransferase
MRILLFGDGAWAAGSLLQLAADHNPIGVVIRKSPSDHALEEAAKKVGLPVFQPDNVNATEFVEKVAALSPDLSLSISYNQILKAPVLETARLGFVNFHAGKLPFYRGRNVINWAIINGEMEIGLTAHFVDDGIDTGDIILQRVFPIPWTDTYGDVLKRIVDNFPGFVVEAVERIASGCFDRVQQSHLPGTYFAGREDGDEWLDWSDSSVNLYNKVRAITRPGPGARTLLADKVTLIWRAFYNPAWPKYIATPGQVIGRSHDGVLVKTGDSLLLVQEVQVSDRACERPSWRIGTRLGIDLASSMRTVLARLDQLEQQLLSTREEKNAAPAR